MTEENPFKILFIQTQAGTKIYCYSKVEGNIYKFYYTAEGGIGSINIDLSKVDLANKEKFIQNEAIPSFIDFTWIDGIRGDKQFISQMMGSLVAKLGEKIYVPHEKTSEDLTYKLRYEESAKLNDKLLEIIDKKING